MFLFKQLFIFFKVCCFCSLAPENELHYVIRVLDICMSVKIVISKDTHSHTHTQRERDRQKENELYGQGKFV
jgi:hypothetical protein